MFATLLDTIADVTGLVVTADALHTQREHAEYPHRRGAHYVITVKGNQKTLRNQLAGLPWKDVPIGHRETDTSHGRVVTRTYKVVTVAAGIMFPHAAQAVQIVRTRKRKGCAKRATRETVYAVTSLTAAQAQPAELARYIRGHWHVENRLHWVRRDDGRRRLPDTHRPGSQDDGQSAQPRHQPATPGRPHQHRQSPAPHGKKPQRAIKLISTS